jgi:hypothetical protein
MQLKFARSRMGAIHQGLGHQEADACTGGLPSHLERNSKAILERTNHVVLNEEVGVLTPRAHMRSICGRLPHDMT